MFGKDLKILLVSFNNNICFLKIFIYLFFDFYLGRADVDKAVNTIPDALKTPPPAAVAAAAAVTEKEKEVPSQVSVSSAGTKREESEKSESEEEVVEIPAKKSKVEGKHQILSSLKIILMKIFYRTTCSTSKNSKRTGEKSGS